MLTPISRASLCVARFALLTVVVCVSPRAIAQTTFTWSGYEWQVKEGVAGPGGNYWSALPQSVNVDDQGQLQMAIRQRLDGTWTSSEVILTQSLSYGLYEFEVATDYTLFPDNVVAGLFTYDSDLGGQGTEPFEIDIELTTAFDGNNNGIDENLFYTTHGGGASTSYATTLDDINTTHRFYWNPNQVVFESFYGHVAGQKNPASAMVPATINTGVVPVDLDELVHINFWLFDRAGGLVGEGPFVGPDGGENQQLTLASFTYTPSLFADVLSSNTLAPGQAAGDSPAAALLGVPDRATAKLTNADTFEQGFVTVGFSGAQAIDNDGDDLAVYFEDWSRRDDFEVFASIDGITFFQLVASDSTSNSDDQYFRTFDLATAGLDVANYIRIVNDDAPDQSRNGGADFDAVELLPGSWTDYQRLAGDVSGDNQIDAADLAIILANWGRATTAFDFPAGDLTGDGRVDAQDLNQVLNYWNAQQPPPTLDVPEPATGTLFLLMLMGLAARRRPRKGPNPRNVPAGRARQVQPRSREAAKESR